MSEVNLTSKNYSEEVEKSTIPVLIDFWATWCGPCMMEAPVIEELANELDDVTVGKINVDTESDLAMMYGVMSIPTIMLFKNGECVNTCVGYRSKEELLEIVEKYR